MKKKLKKFMAHTNAYIQHGLMEKIGNSYEDIRKYYKM